MITSQDHDQIYPALRPRFTSMPVKDYSTSRCQRLELIEQLTDVSTRTIQTSHYAGSCLVFVNNMGVPLGVEIFVQLLFLDELAYVDMSQRNGRFLDE